VSKKPTKSNTIDNPIENPIEVENSMFLPSVVGAYSESLGEFKQFLNRLRGMRFPLLLQLNLLPAVKLLLSHVDDLHAVISNAVQAAAAEIGDGVKSVPMDSPQGLAISAQYAELRKKSLALPLTKRIRWVVPQAGDKALPEMTSLELDFLQTYLLDIVVERGPDAKNN